MASQGIRCALGNHLIRGRGVIVTNRKHISFIKQVRPNYRPYQKMCQQCKEIIEQIYKTKILRKRRRKLQSSISVSSLSTSEDNINSSSDKPTTRKRARAEKSASSSTMTTEDETPINIRRGIRLPHIQPAIKRQTFVHANPDIMRMYLQGVTGG